MDRRPAGERISFFPPPSVVSPSVGRFLWLWLWLCHSQGKKWNARRWMKRTNVGRTNQLTNALSPPFFASCFPNRATSAVHSLRVCVSECICAWGVHVFTCAIRIVAKTNVRSCSAQLSHHVVARVQRSPTFFLPPLSIPTFSTFNLLPYLQHEYFK